MATHKTRYDELREEAIRFHKANPKVWKLFVKFTLERINIGFTNYSVNAIFERIRWETDQAPTDGQTAFKLCNNHRPFYARAFMRKYPEYDGFFRLREQTSKREVALHIPELTPADYCYTTLRQEKRH